MEIGEAAMNDNVIDELIDRIVWAMDTSAKNALANRDALRKLLERFYDIKRKEEQ